MTSALCGMRRRPEEGYQTVITAVSLPTKPRKKHAGGASLARTSDILRAVLSNNPNVETFTIGSILDAIGADRVEASMMLFSVPAVVPVTGAPAFSGVSSCALGGHFVRGRTSLKVPKVILSKTVPRRSLAAAVHALLPILERAEKLMKPRLAWLVSPVARRLLGVLLFVLAVTIAFPVIGLDPLHGTSIFMISLGLAEKDGLAVLIGAAVGILSLALIASAGLTLKSLRAKAAKLLKKLVRRLGLDALAFHCEQRGWKRLADILRFRWADVLLMWDPEGRNAAPETPTAARAGKTAAPRRAISSTQPRPVRRSAEIAVAASSNTRRSATK